MYPNLYYAFKDLFGIEISWLKFVNSFGFFVAIAFVLGAYVLGRELKRKETEGKLTFKLTEQIKGRPASTSELLLNFILGFLLGYKIIGLFLLPGNSNIDPQQYIFSSEGNWLAGILLGAVFAGMKWYEKNKQKLEKPVKEKIKVWPHERVGDILIIAAIFGFLGAKIFHNLENWDEFTANPIEALLSFSGLTFYGGLICAGIAILYFARKNNISMRHLADAMAPALILAYGIGRVGCHVAGDGDWGILNSAYISTAAGNMTESDPETFKNAVEANSQYFLRAHGIKDIENVRHMALKAPSWLPDWMVAYNYPNNVLDEGIPIEGCEGMYCSQLPVPAFPTPFYETIACLLIFSILWGLRKKIHTPGVIFGIYLIFNGLERFFIEKIRVNNKYDFGFIHPTQAELISFGLILTGILLIYFMKKREIKN